MSGALLAVTVAATVAGVGAGAGAVGTAAPLDPSVATTAAERLPKELSNGVVLRLADGDRFKVWHSRDLRTVWGRRYDAATATWGGRTVLVRERDLYCGGVEARAAGTSVAVTARCDRGYYHEENAPTSSRALWSADLVTWQAHRLDGEAYREPGISPDGASAVWPQSGIGSYLTLTPTEGFVDRSISVPGLEYTETAVIDDDGRVSVLYGGSVEPDSDDCVVAVATQLRDEAPVRQYVPMPDACSVEVDLVNVDARTVVFGQPWVRAQATELARADTSSPWAVTSPAPADAPSLVMHDGRALMGILDVPGWPLVSLGSADRRTFETQTYDAATRTWSAPRRVARLEGPCRWDQGGSLSDSIFVASVQCDGRSKALISTDASSWTTVPVSRPIGVSARGGWVSISTSRSTSVFSREEGRVDIALGGPRRCDVVLPASPRSALRLTTARPSGWPTVLQQSTRRGWRRTDTTLPRVPADAGACTGVRSAFYDGRPTYLFAGRRHGLVVKVVPRGDGWAVRRTYL
jgi:hypothetical protein